MLPFPKSAPFGQVRAVLLVISTIHMFTQYHLGLYVFGMLTTQIFAKAFAHTKRSQQQRPPQFEATQPNTNTKQEDLTQEEDSL